MKKKFYQCIDCKKYKKAVPHFGELPEMCPDCSEIKSKKNSCKKHGGIAKTSKNCTMCKVEIRLNNTLPRINRIFAKAMRN